MAGDADDDEDAMAVATFAVDGRLCESASGDQGAERVRDRTADHRVAALTATVADLEDRFAAMRRRLEVAGDALDDLHEEMRRRH